MSSASPRRVAAAVLAAAGACFLWVAWMTPTTAETDYSIEAEPALQALRDGRVADFLDLAPAYGGSLILRAPFAFLPDLWGGGDLAVFRSMAVPCLIAAVFLAVLLWGRSRSFGAGRGAAALVLFLCAANPVTLKALKSGHPEELLGAVLCVGAVLAGGARRPILAGALLGLAVANKPWAVLAAVPVGVALGGRHRPCSGECRQVESARDGSASPRRCGCRRGRRGRARATPTFRGCRGGPCGCQHQR